MSRPPRIEPSGEVVARIASTALALPDTCEEDAWTGVRWRVRNKTFAHVLVAQEGYTSAYRDMTGVTEPTTVLTFRSSGDELLALANAGPPFYKPPWSPTVVGMVLDDDTDWDEVAELLTESYRFCAPQKLRHRLDNDVVRSGKGGPGSTRTPPEPGTGTVWISPVEDYWYAIWDYSKDAGPHSYRALAGPEDMTREQAIAWARQRPAERIFIHEGQDWAPL